MPARACVNLVDGRALSDTVLSGFVGWLGAGELARYQRFTRPERRRQFLIGRVLARQMLGRLLAAPPRTLGLVDAVGQKPVLADGHGVAGFSISHSGPWVACAVSGDCALGLDIEVIDAARDIGALAEHAFDAQRQADLAASPAHSRTRDFYLLWSGQEARIKLGAAPADSIELFHPQLAIVLCSAFPLAAAPELQCTTLVCA